MDLAAWKELAETVQAAITSMGFVVAAIWTYLLFVRRRQKFPRVKLDHRVRIFHISGIQSLVHVQVKIQNIGEVLVRIDSAIIHIGQVLPLQPSILEQLELREGDADTKWPSLGRRECDWSEDPYEIEPGETEDFHFDFLIPRPLGLIEVHSYFKNSVKRRREIGWRDSAFVRPEEDSPSLEAERGENDEQADCRPRPGPV